MQDNICTPGVSAASKVAHTTDILDIIFSHISARNDLVSLLRTSTLFFRLVDRKLYQSISISNKCNPFFGIPYGDISGGRGGFYGKARLLEFVRAVVVERASVPIEGSVWKRWRMLPPLPLVDTVIMQPADSNTQQDGGSDRSLPKNALVERLCPNATHLCLSLPWLTPGAKQAHPVPSFPKVKTLVIKSTAANIGDYHFFLGHQGKAEWPNVTMVHLYIWGDLVSPRKYRRRLGWPNKAEIDWSEILAIGNGTYKELEAIHDYNLDCLMHRIATLLSISALRLYNVEEMLDRLKSWKMTRRTFKTSRGRMERAFREEMRDVAKYSGLSDKSAEVDISWRPAQEFYQTFGGAWDHSEDERWYRSTVLDPSPRLVALRARLAVKTAYPVSNFIGLTESDAEYALAAYKG
ncbi:hypothetical protein L198_00023 [Cryptococcus wingfieldii CBS 7118]|uniref:Uncharacterized protein n=1 Tax=Cryptococcus wingfieldii CBS 7118 TaxID=1295528 RepID=A0A1E3K570_9TREE|nr:hypothetical protein L198_00023 [Cryptococcus wingfieldii CBS 7118]ODO08300.1 hypothetical protein L198_00023 [Cryptococcus wingfieldii CBS 7118]